MTATVWGWCPCEEVPAVPCECDCVNCAPINGEYSDNAPCCWAVQITGITNSDPEDCEGCSALNRDYYLRQTDDDCRWYAPVGCQPCAPTSIYLDVVCEDGVYIIRVTMGEIVWEKAYGDTRPPCCRINALPLTRVSDATDCDSTSATCHITAHACGHTASFGCANYYFHIPAEWSVDFSGAAWTDDRCKMCDEAAREYILGNPYSFSFGFAYEYTEADYCAPDVTPSRLLVRFSVECYSGTSAAGQPYGYLKFTAHMEIGQPAYGLVTADYTAYRDLWDSEGNCIPIPEMLDANGDIILRSPVVLPGGTFPPCGNNQVYNGWPPEIRATPLFQ